MNRIWLASTAILALSGGLLADTVTSTSGSFTAFPSGFASSTPAWVSYATPLATPGTPFWNDPSGDTGTGGSHMMSVGYLLTDTGGFVGTPSVLGSDTVSSDYVTSSGADPSSFSFVSTATAYNISLLFADSSLDTGNPAQGTVFGYYVGSTYTPLYTPTDTSSPTTSVPFDPTTAGNAYGFYATVCYGAGQCETYTTGQGNSGNSPGAASWNHFAVFQLASGSYVIALEDTNNYGGEGLGDYNDIVVELKTTATPEPRTTALIGLGLAGFGLLGRRRYLRKAARA